MRGWVPAVANYSTPVGIGEVMRAFSAGTIVASRHPSYGEGDTIMGMLGWQEYAISDGSTITRKVKEKENDLPFAVGSFRRRRRGDVLATCGAILDRPSRDELIMVSLLRL